VHQYPRKGGESQDHRSGYRPSANANIAGGLPQALIASDLAVSRLVLLLDVFHRLYLPLVKVDRPIILLRRV
jgi:hypothetical protein